MESKTRGTTHDGFIAFTSLLVISAAVLAISVSIALLGIGEAKASLDFAKGQECRVLAESCIEEGLLRLRDNVSYTGGSLNQGSGSCTISVSGSGSDQIIVSVAVITGPPDYTKKIQATVKKTGDAVAVASRTEIP